MYKLKELLSPEQFIAPIHTRLTELEQAYKTKQQEVKRNPSGLIRIVKNHGQLQFYKRKSKSDLQGTYMPRSQNQLAYKLIQSDYDKKALAAIKEEISFIKLFLTKYQTTNTNHHFKKLPDSRQKIVTPLTLTDSKYAELWLSEKYSGKEISPDIPKLLTDKGEQVRSKSEVLIANALKASGIPYRYEFPIKINLKAGDPSQVPVIQTFHPDFYCLNLRTRKEYIWEHFGMMDNIAYANKNIVKIEAYEQSGYFLGKNMIMTFETSQHAISSNIIKAMIKEYLV